MIAALCIALIAASLDMQRGRVVGLIEDLSGAVSIKTAADATAAPLDPRRDVARLVYAGEQLRCSAGATLRLRIEDTARIIKCPSDWIELGPASTERSRTLQSVLDAYGRTGGRSRGPGGRIVIPADEGVVMPSTFVIRWHESPATRTVSLAIAEIGGRTLWHQDNVPGAPGALVSQPARDALLNYRKAGGAGRLVLRITDASRQSSQITFSLLSVQAEQALKDELASWDRETEPLIRHLFRAMTYGKAGLPVEETEEYEAALRAAPDSRDVLRRTIVANERIGNSARAAELTKRLSQGESYVHASS